MKMMIFTQNVLALIEHPQDRDKILRDTPQVIEEVLSAWYERFHNVGLSFACGHTPEEVANENSNMCTLAQILEHWARIQGLNPQRELSIATTLLFGDSSIRDSIQHHKNEIEKEIEKAWPLYNEIREHALHVARTSRQKAATPAPANGEAVKESAPGDWIKVGEAARIYKQRIDNISDGIKTKAAEKAVSTACNNGYISSTGNKLLRRIDPASLQVWIQTKVDRKLDSMD